MEQIVIGILSPLPETLWKSNLFLIPHGLIAAQNQSKRWLLLLSSYCASLFVPLAYPVNLKENQGTSSF